MRQSLTGEKVWRGCMNTSFEDSNDLIVFSDSIECRVLDGSCRFVCYFCCFLYGYRFDVCIWNSKYDCFCCFCFFYQEYIKRWKTTLLSSFEQLTKMGHFNDLFCGEVTELFKYSNIIYNILKWFFHKEVNLLEFIIYLHQSFFWAFRHCMHGAADIIKSAHNTRGTLNKEMKKYQNKYVTHCYLEWTSFHIPSIETCWHTKTFDSVLIILIIIIIITTITITIIITLF